MASKNKSKWGGWFVAKECEGIDDPAVTGVRCGPNGTVRLTRDDRRNTDIASDDPKEEKK